GRKRKLSKARAPIPDKGSHPVLAIAVDRKCRPSAVQPDRADRSALERCQRDGGLQRTVALPASDFQALAAQRYRALLLLHPPDHRVARTIDRDRHVVDVRTAIRRP